AERIGLVNRVVPPEDLMKATMELATKIANGPSVAIELIKRSVLLGLKHDWTTQQYFETYAQHIALQTEDFKEGMTAFLEKRKPTFRGR
ncbi:MAG: hypothetical protein HY675_20520, partial [Chloroflexi bacterium]|nr:hypothetical protein [Chloroflexota bacterium]